MPYLSLYYADDAEADDQVVYVDAYPRLQVTTGQSIEFNENGLIGCEFTTDEPQAKKK